MCNLPIDTDSLINSNEIDAKDLLTPQEQERRDELLIALTDRFEKKFQKMKLKEKNKQCQEG